MLPVAAFLLMQTAQSDKASVFIEEARKAVVAVDEGSWIMEVKVGEHTITTGIRRKRADSYVRSIYDTATTHEISTVGGQTLSLRYGDSTYVRYPEPSAEKAEQKQKDAEKVGDDEFKFFFSPARGFVIAASPGFINTVVTSGEEIETMISDLVQKDGTKKGWVRYDRDTKSKLPIHAEVHMTDNTVVFNFNFTRRPVTSDELIIPEARYKDFKKAEPPKDSN